MRGGSKPLKTCRNFRNFVKRALRLHSGPSGRRGWDARRVKEGLRQRGSTPEVKPQPVDGPLVAGCRPTRVSVSVVAGSGVMRSGC